jgi:hypothetical protein
MSLNDYLNCAAAYFKKRYNLSFELNERNALATSQGLVNEIKETKRYPQKKPKPHLPIFIVTHHRVESCT